MPTRAGDGTNENHRKSSGKEAGESSRSRIGAGVAQLVEQLICNQQVAGSSPFASSVENKETDTKGFGSPGLRLSSNVDAAILNKSSEGFPSGQREQTVNLSSLTSKVRILPPPQRQNKRGNTAKHGEDE